MIPYYEHHSGIRTHPAWKGGNFYVVLDKKKTDALPMEMWEVFESVVAECRKELMIPLILGESFEALSPEGDRTYVLNMISVRGGTDEQQRLS